MPRWSRKQDEYLWEHANDGPERIARDMRRRFGVARTPEAVRRHAYRIGAAVVAYEVCPSCGGKHDHLMPSGVCRVCNLRRLAEGQRRRNDEIRAEIVANQSAPELRKAEREFEAERSRTYRLRQKLGASR